MHVIGSVGRKDQSVVGVTLATELCGGKQGQLSELPRDCDPERTCSTGREATRITSREST